jgi:hypothetical protein
MSIATQTGDTHAHAEAASIAKQLQPGMDAARVNAITIEVHRIEKQDGILIDCAIAGYHTGAGARWSKAWP